MGVERSPGEEVLASVSRLLWALCLPMMCLLTALTTLQYQQRMAEAEQTISFLLDQRALDLDQLTRPAADHVDDLRALMLAQWRAPPDRGPALAQLLAPRQHRGRVDGYSLDQAEPARRDRYGQVWWAQPDGSPPPEHWLRRAVSFVELARVAHQRVPAFESTWFAGADTNVAFGYPWQATSRIVETMGTDGLMGIAAVRAQATQASRTWLTRVAPRTSWWGSPEASQLEGHAVISHGAVLLVDGVFVGEVSVDFRLDDLQRHLTAWAKSTSGRHWIVSETGEVLADSAAPVVLVAGQQPDSAEVGFSLHTKLTDHLPVDLPSTAVRRALSQPGKLIHESGWIVAAGHRDGTPWTYLTARPAAEMRAEVVSSLLPNALIAATLLLMFVAGQWLLSRHFVAPALRILAYLRELSANPHAPVPQMATRWNVWIDAITEVHRSQREAQHRAQQNEVINAAIVDCGVAAIIATDGDGHIVEFNRAAEVMFGKSRLLALGEPVTTLFPARSRTQHEADLARLLTSDENQFIGPRAEWIGLRDNGTEFSAEVMLWRTELNGEVRFTGSIVDLTERSRAHQEIERLREALRRSERASAMSGLLAGVAHELNNPLAVVIGCAELLEDKLADTPLRSDVAHIRDAAERCGCIVRTFLSMARTKPMQRRSVHLNDLANAGVDMLGYAWRSHGITVHLNLSNSIPPVNADPDQLGQVVLNLLINAQQALAGTDGPRRVVVASGNEPQREDRSTRVWLRIADNGPGIASDLQASIFEPFFSTKNEGMGTGLGLAVSRAIARSHGGELLLEGSSHLRGASFRLSLPLGEDGPVDGRVEPVAAPTTPVRARVLVVDDESDIASLMMDMLESAGYKVATADSGVVALEQLALATFDAIVSDLRMPDMDGAALWREIRRHWPSLAQRVLFVTGDTLSASARQFLDETGCPHLDKPFAKNGLLGAVAALVALPIDG